MNRITVSTFPGGLAMTASPLGYPYTLITGEKDLYIVSLLETPESEPTNGGFYTSRAEALGEALETLVRKNLEGNIE